MDEIAKLSERLDACVAGADEDEAQMRGRLARLELRVRSLELSEDAVAEGDRVGEVLEAEAVLSEAGHREDARDGAEREHELVVADVEHTRVRRLDVREPLLLVDRGHAAEHELGVGAHLPERHDRVPRLERARGRLREHRRVEHEVLRADDRRAVLAEQPGDVAAREAAADHQHPASRLTHPAIVAATVVN